MEPEAGDEVLSHRHLKPLQLPRVFVSVVGESNKAIVVLEKVQQIIPPSRNTRC